MWCREGALYDALGDNYHAVGRIQTTTRQVGDIDSNEVGLQDRRVRAGVAVKAACFLVWKHESCGAGDVHVFIDSDAPLTAAW